MTDTQIQTITCTACGKTRSSTERCCDFAGAKSPAISVAAEIIIASGDHVPIAVKWLRLGREADNDIILKDDGYVSRYHAWITFEDDHFWVEDLGSTNGTLLNSQPLVRRELLASGDKIKIGESEMSFVLLEKPGQDS
jgi:pSer/pThr/pTyr-binding forkhead associated (FHA) protein